MFRVIFCSTFLVLATYASIPAEFPESVIEIPNRHKFQSQSTATSNLRFRVLFPNVKDTTVTCANAGDQIRTDMVACVQGTAGCASHPKIQYSGMTKQSYLPVKTTCTSADILTDAMRSKLTQAFQIATSYVANALRATQPFSNMNLKTFFAGCDPSVRYCGYLSTASAVFCGPNFFYTYPDEGYPETDFVLYVDVQPISGSTFAIAGTCISEATVSGGRPIVGHVTVNPRMIQTSTDARDLAQTLTHEIFHALGFLGTSWGTKKAAFQERSNNGASVSTFKHTDTGVLSRTSTHFGCSTVNGCEFDSGDYYSIDHACDDPNNINPLYSSLCSITIVNGVKYATPKTTAIEAMKLQVAGSHWSERLFGSELMTPYALAYGSGERLPVSAMTLAALEGLGYYAANYNYADKLYQGNGAGCAFATGLPSQWPGKYFCNSSVPSCSPDYTAPARCTITTYSGDLPLAYSYFTNRKLGGNLQQDYFPLVQTLSGSSCLEDSSATSSTINSECMGTFCNFPQQFGLSSRCFMSNIRASSTTTFTPKPACFKSECTNNGGVWTLRVNVQNTWYTCNSQGQTFGPNTSPTPSLTSDPVWKQGSFVGTGVCPDPTDFCNTNVVCTALHTCSGHGYCSNGQCVCNADPVMGYWTGANCNQCASGWTETSTGCLRKVGTTSDACVIELLTGIQCNGRGKCSADGSGNCDCSDFNTRTGSKWGGSKCDVCAIGYDAATCTQVVCVDSQCGKGKCGASGTCTCYSDSTNGYWTGQKCDACQSAYMGTDCKTARVVCPSSCVGVSVSSTSKYDCQTQAYPIFSAASKVDQCGCPTTMDYPSCTAGTARGPTQCPAAAAASTSRNLNCGYWQVPDNKFNQCNCTDPDPSNVCLDPFGCTVDETLFKCSDASKSSAATRCSTQTCPGASTWTPALDCSGFPFMWQQQLRATECGCTSPPLPVCTPATSSAPMLRYVTSPPPASTPVLSCNNYGPITADNNPYFKAIKAYIAANGGDSALDTGKKFKFDAATGTVYLNCFGKFPDFEIKDQVDGCGFQFPIFKCYPNTAITYCSCSSLPFSGDVDCQGKAWAPVIDWPYPHVCNCPVPKAKCIAGTELACKCPPVTSPVEVDCRGRKLIPAVVNDKCNPCPSCVQPTAFVCKAGTDQPTLPPPPATTAPPASSPSSTASAAQCTLDITDDLSVGCPMADASLLSPDPANEVYPSIGLLICPEAALSGSDINPDLGVSQFLIDFVANWRATKPCCAFHFSDSQDSPLYFNMWCDPPLARNRHRSVALQSTASNICGGKGSMYCAPYTCVNGLCRQDCEVDTHCAMNYKCCGKKCVAKDADCSAAALGCTSDPSSCAPYVCGTTRTQPAPAGSVCSSACSSDENCAIGYVCTVSLLPSNGTSLIATQSDSCPIPDAKPTGQCVPASNTAPGVSCFCHSACGNYVCGQNRNQNTFILARCRSSCSDDLHCNEGFKCQNAKCIAGAGAPTTPVRDEFCYGRAFDYCLPYACGSSANAAPVPGSRCRSFCLMDSHCLPMHTCVAGSDGKGVCTPSIDFSNGLQRSKTASQTLVWEARPGVFFNVEPFAAPAPAPSSSVKCATNPDICLPYRCGLYGVAPGDVSPLSVCQTACSLASDCTVGYYCADHKCNPKRSLGTVCSENSQCGSGFCAQGICCTSACTEKCKTCSNMGICGWVSVGTDPAGHCSSCQSCQFDPSLPAIAQSDSRVCLAAQAGLDPKNDCSGHGVCNGGGSCACDKNQNGQGYWGGKKCNTCDKGFFFDGAKPCTLSTSSINSSAVFECLLRSAQNRSTSRHQMKALEESSHKPKLVIVPPKTTFDDCDCSGHGKCTQEGRCECHGGWHGGKCEHPGGQEHLHLQHIANTRRMELHQRHEKMNPHLSSTFHSLQVTDGQTSATTLSCTGQPTADPSALPSAVKGTSVARQYANTVLDVVAGPNPKQTADQLLGRPDVFPRNIVSDLAWTPKQVLFDSAAPATQTVSVRFLQPVYASGIEVYENNAPGNVVKMEVRQNELSTWESVYENNAAPLANAARVFAPSIRRVSYKVQDVRVTIRTSGSLQVQVDAIALLGFVRSDMTFCPGDIVNTVGDVVPCAGNGYCSPLGCECFGHYAGPMCNYCAFGWSGDECDIPFSPLMTTGARLCKISVFEEMSQYSASAAATQLLLSRWILTNQKELQSTVVPNGKVFAATRIRSPRYTLGTHTHVHLNIGLLLADIPLEMGSNTGVVISVSSDQSGFDQRVIFLKHYNSFQGLNMIGEESADAMDTLDLYVPWSTNTIVVTTEVWPADSSYRHTLTSLLVEECTYPNVNNS